MFLSRRLLTLITVLFLATPMISQAQEATPESTSELEVVASGLTNPRGMAWDADGTLYVALAGSGGTTVGMPEFDPPYGPLLGGPTAAIAHIDADGCPAAFATGFPSYVDSTGGVIGVADVAFLDDQLYALEAAGTELYGNPDATTGLYRVNDDGTTELVADYAAWLAENPPDVAGWMQPPDIPEDFPNPGNLYAMVAVDDLFWVVDAVNGLILTISPDDGDIQLMADLSVGHPVPTGIAPAPEGGVYVGTLTAVPYPDGEAKVVHITPDGTVTDAWTGLTMVTDVAVDPDGALYAIEMSTGNPEDVPFVVPESGRIVRQAGPDQLEVVADGLMFPVALAVAPDGSLHVSMPAIGADTGSGTIMRVLRDGEAASTAETPTCEPLPETTDAPRAPEDGTPEG